MFEQKLTKPGIFLVICETTMLEQLGPRRKWKHLSPTLEHRFMSIDVAGKPQLHHPMKGQELLNEYIFSCIPTISIIHQAVLKDLVKKKKKKMNTF